MIVRSSSGPPNGYGVGAVSYPSRYLDVQVMYPRPFGAAESLALKVYINGRCSVESIGKSRTVALYVAISDLPRAN
jgi:hypothetical protein